MSTNHIWPVKLMCSDYPEYTWPYGARALMAEREKVEKVLALSAEMVLGYRYGGHYANIFIVPLTFKEGFVRNDTERMTLIDRVRKYHNFNWKQDVTGRPDMNTCDCGMTASDRHYARLIDNLLEMQALTEELQRETLELIWTCKSVHELQQGMLNARV
jgi:hypothetical protein